MRILLTGASGYVGGYLLDGLLKRGYGVTCLVRDSEKNKNFLHGKNVRNAGNLKIVIGDLLDKKSLDVASRNVDAVIHAAAAVRINDYRVNYEVNVIGTRNLVEASRKNNVKRFIYMSSVSAIRKRKGPYGETKLLGEKEVENSDLIYTILRPPTIYGAGGQGTENIIRFVKMLPFIIPVVGDGHYRIQPVAIHDVVDVTIECINNKNTYYKAYSLAGREAMPFKQFIQLFAREMGVGKKTISFPVWVCTAGAFVLEKMGKKTLTREHVRSLTEDITQDISGLEKDIGYKPISLQEGLKRMFMEMSLFSLVREKTLGKKENIRREKTLGNTKVV